MKKDTNVTLKYPSDGDENQAVVKPPDSTQKYPSDTDESGSV